MATSTSNEASIDSPSTQQENSFTLSNETFIPPKSASKMTAEDLDARDRNAVAYSKAQLSDGDTLILIKYPINCEVFDATGFKMGGESFKVHSEKLLATGSKIFAKLFSDWEQTKFRRRNGYINSLPPGIRYILNLTPPEEGDEAVDLTAELYCSPGIRSWYTAQKRCSVPRDLCGGMDDIARPKKQKPVHKQHNSLVDAFTDLEFEPEFPTNPNSSVDFDDTNKVNDTQKASMRAETLFRQDTELLEVIQRSKTDVRFKPEILENTYESIEDVPAYCPIRHRVGIEKLLQLIEGKSPRFDSAPKIWTLFVLAKYFDCTNIVVDQIVAWVSAEPNCRFIEILPEATLKMGLGLQAPILVRSAFAILVSEHALTTLSRESGSIRADAKFANQFGRSREDIGEDDLDAIQAAAYQFATRVDNLYEKLLDLEWLTLLPEYQKLLHFKEWVESNWRKTNGSGFNSEKYPATDTIDKLISVLVQFVRGSVICRLNGLPSQDVMNDANVHRRAESYLKDYNGDFRNDIYKSMNEKEKMMTVFSWQHLLSHGFRSTGSNLLFDTIGIDAWDLAVNEKLAATYKIEPVKTWNLQADVFEVNTLVLKAAQNQGYQGRSVPKESTYLQDTEDDWGSPVSLDKMTENVESDSPISQPESDQTKVPQQAINALSNRTARQTIPAETTPAFTLHIPAKQDTIRSSSTSNEDPFVQSFGHKQALDSDAISTTGVFNFELGNDELHKDVGISTHDNYRLPMRPAKRYDYQTMEKMPLLDKRPAPDDSWSSALDTPGLGYARKRSKENVDTDVPLRDPFISGDELDENDPPWVTQSLTNRISNIIKAGTSFLATKHHLDPREEAIATHSIGASQNGSSLASWPTPPAHAPKISRPTKPSTLAVPEERLIFRDSPFFSLTRFSSQVQNHVRSFASSMLSKDELDFAVLTDTLVCLTDEEWKYLPLWAGGSNDGTGGVFGNAPPPAPAGSGPSGPGPSFHTGYSINSRASTEMDFDGISTIGGSIDTSVAVENGYSDHLDRRQVIAESEDFHSDAFSDDTEKYDILEEDAEVGVDKGKGKVLQDDFGVVDTEDPTADIPPVVHFISTPKVEEDMEWDSGDEEEPFDFGEDVEDDQDRKVSF